jgi:hypothetical protein
MKRLIVHGTIKDLAELSTMFECAFVWQPENFVWWLVGGHGTGLWETVTFHADCEASAWAAATNYLKHFFTAANRRRRRPRAKARLF